MIWLSNSTLARLRDQLLETGGRASIVAAPDAGAAYDLIAKEEAEQK